MHTCTLTPPYPTLLASAQNRCSTVGAWVAFELTIKTQSRNLLSSEAGAIFFSQQNTKNCSLSKWLLFPTAFGNTDAKPCIKTVASYAERGKGF